MSPEGWGSGDSFCHFSVQSLPRSLKFSNTLPNWNSITGSYLSSNFFSRGLYKWPVLNFSILIYFNHGIWWAYLRSTFLSQFISKWWFAKISTPILNVAILNSLKKPPDKTGPDPCSPPHMLLYTNLSIMSVTSPSYMTSLLLIPVTYELTMLSPSTGPAPSRLPYQVPSK